MGRRNSSEWPANSIFRLVQTSKKSRLGPLEHQVLSVLWRRGGGTVHEVINYGDVRREYNTVMTTLKRLYRKRLIERAVVPNSRAFRYVPRHHTQDEWEREVVIGAVRQILSTTELPLCYLVEAICDHDARLLDDLRRLVDEKCERLRRER